MQFFENIFAENFEKRNLNAKVFMTYSVNK